MSDYFCNILRSDMECNMSIGISNLTNYGINHMDQRGKVTGQSGNADYNSVLSEKITANAEAQNIDEYTDYLKIKYGSSILVQNVGKDQKSIDAIGAGTFGTGNVVIASNILEEMANNPEKAAYYEGKIQHYFDSLPKCKAELSAMGHEIHSSGIIIHPDGTVTHYISGDLKPEVRAKIEAQIKAEREAKEKRKQEFLELSQEAADKRHEIAESNLKKQILDEALRKQMLAQNSHLEENEMRSAVFAYEKAVPIMNDNTIKKK